MKKIALALAMVGALTLGAAPAMAGGGHHGYHRGHHGHHGHHGGHHGHYSGHRSYSYYAPRSSYGCYDDYSYGRSYYRGPSYGVGYYSPGFSFSFGR